MIIDKIETSIEVLQNDKYVVLRKNGKFGETIFFDDINDYKSFIKEQYNQLFEKEV